MKGPDPWGGQNPLGCCRDNRTEGGVLTHGGPDCRWPGTTAHRPDYQDLPERTLWHDVAYHQGNTTFGPIYARAKALREHPAMVELLRRAAAGDLS